MSSDIPPELAETLKSLDQAIEEFHQIKEQLRAGPVQEVVQETIASLALPVEAIV
jgi:hypothetical protein